MKADEVRLYALRGGLKKQSVCYTHFHSNKVFRGDLISEFFQVKVIYRSVNHRAWSFNTPESHFLVQFQRRFEIRVSFKIQITIARRSRPVFRQPDKLLSVAFAQSVR